MTSTVDRQAKALKAWVILSRAYAAVQGRASADIAARDLTVGEFAVLEVLHHRGPLLLSQLKDKVLVSAGGVTYLVDRLAERGLVERRRCEHDRRAFYAALTEDGEAFISRIFPGHAEAIQLAFKGLSDAEIETLTVLLRRLGLSAAG